MKIAMVSSHGGHLTELRMLGEGLDDQDLVYVTYESERTRNLNVNSNVHTIKHIGTDPIAMLIAFCWMLGRFRKDRPDLVISTGSEIAIPAFVAGKIVGASTIFIESWCRVTTRSTTGRIVYPIVDHFFVQWPQLLNEYGEKAEFRGAVI